MRIALYTLFFENYKPLADVVLPNWQDYADRHGYAIHYHCGKPEDFGSRPIGFQKMQYVYDELFLKDNPYDVVWVLDLDILVTNFNTRVEDFLDHTHDYFVTTGVHGLCNGSFFLKKSDVSRRIIEYMLENKHGYDNEQNMLKCHLDDPLLRGHIRLFPYYAFSSLLFELYPERAHLTCFEKPWRCGDFVLHLAAVPLEKRLAIFQSQIIRDSIIK